MCLRRALGQAAGRAAAREVMVIYSYNRGVPVARPRPRCTAHGRARSYGFLLAGHRAPPVVLRAAGTARGEVARGDGARKQAQTARGETARTAREDGADGARK